MNSKEKNYSWMGSPNAGFILSMAAAVGAVMIVVAGFGK